MPEPAFVGEGRSAVVTGLLEAYDRIRAGEPAQWIALEAPSGWGKTRLLRELYRRLAAHRQPEPHYWPGDLFGADVPEEVGARRKRLVPEVEHTPGSLPAFMWWGIACSLRGGVSSASLRHDLAQLQAHADYLEDAWRQVAPARGRWRSGLKDLGIAAADEAAMEAAGTAVEAVVGAAIPGLGLVRWLGERGVAGVRAAAERRERLDSSERIAASDLVAETAAMVDRLAVPELPVVIVVEDLHDADAGLADLLGSLVSGTASVLVISTSWPGRTEDNEHVRRALTAAGDRVVRLDHRSERAPEPFGPDASLAALDPAALEAIVRSHYPQVEQRTAALIAGRYPNPLALELFCQLPRVRRRGRSGELRLDAATIAEAPAEIRGLYAELWRELPETVREALSLATLGIPALLDATAGAGEWNTDLLLAALRELDWPSLPEITEALHTGSDAYSWARSVSTMLRTFTERDQREIAAEDDTFLFDEDRTEVRTAIGAALGAFLTEHVTGLEVTERHHLADLAAVLHAEGFLRDPDVLADAIRPAAELSWDDQRDLPRYLRLLTRAIEAGPSLDRLARAHLLRGHAFQLSGRLAEALADAEAAAHAPEAPELFDLEVLNLRAQVLTGLYRTDDAVRAHQKLATRMEQVCGAAHPDTLATHATLAGALSQAGRGEEAVELIRRTVAVGTQHLTGDDGVLLGMRGTLAALLGDHGHTEEALSLLTALEADCVRALGPEHPRTLTVRRNRAAGLHMAGQHVAAVELQRALLVIHHQALGPDHPSTFLLRRQLGSALAEGSDPQEAVDVLTALHAREVEVLGWDHPDVQSTRRLVAEIALRTGDAATAVRLLERHVRDCERIFGADSLPLRTAQAKLAAALTHTDRAAEATPLLEDVVRALHTLTEPGSEQMFHARQLLGRLRTDTDLGAAEEHLRACAQIAIARWGAADPRTIDARDDVARVLRASGRPAEALHEWEQIAGDLTGHGVDPEITGYLEQTLAEVRAELDSGGA